MGDGAEGGMGAADGQTGRNIAWRDYKTQNDQKFWNGLERDLGIDSRGLGKGRMETDGDGKGRAFLKVHWQN